MKKLTVNVGSPYDILIEKGIMGDCGKYIRKVTNAKKAAIISDTNVAPLYLETVKKSVEGEGFNVFTYVFPAGEISKTTGTVIKIVEYLADRALTRGDLVIALGGGVCGDMAGFAAAIYLRGIKFVQIPTTLLSQVDSSVGGKTGVNLPQGKNLCGAFHQPALVLIDPCALDTLNEHYFRDGMGEVIKYGCIKSPELFNRLSEEDPRNFIEDLIFECVDIKRGIVERDEKESGERALLNFGHTAGHGIEKLGGFTEISHGEAVGIGMLLISEAGENAGLTQRGTAERIKKLLEKYGMKTKCPYPLKDVVTAMGSDKKRTGSSIKLVLLKEIGTSFIHTVEIDKTKEFFGI